MVFVINIFSAQYKKRVYKDTFLNNFILFLYIFCLFDLIASYKYIYNFKRNEDSKLLFFGEEQQRETYSEIDDDVFNLILLNNKSLLFDEKTHIFSYENNNFLSLEVINDILNSQLPYNPNGKIECNFNLYYFFKLTRDISEIPDEVNHLDIKTIFLGLKYFKAVNNKNLIEFAQALLVKTFLNREKYSLKGNCRYMEGLFDLYLWSKVYFYIKKAFLSSFLNIYMIKYIFIDGNLIILENFKGYYNISIFDEHIPYKNILINNSKVFLFLEKLLQDKFISNFLQILLDEMNLKSLVAHGSIEFEIQNIKLSYLIFSLKAFKSITIYDFMRSSSLLFLENLSVVLRNDLEFLGLEQLQISITVLQSFLKEKKLRGLISKKIYTSNSTVFPDRYISSPEKLEYVKFENVGIKSIWWKSFFSKTRFHTIIVSFNTIYAEKSFIDEFSKFRGVTSLFRYFEFSFHFTEISKEFCDSLLRLNHLQTLKLQNCKTNEQTELYLINSIKNMNKLENITIYKCCFSPKLYDIFFMKQGIKTLNLEINLFEINILEFSFTGNYESLKRIAFVKMTIEMTSLIEIFKLENLEHLSFKFCVFESTIDSQFPNYKSINLKCFYLYRSNLKSLNFMDILSKLNLVEKFEFSYCRDQPGCLTRLSLMCDTNLNILSFKLGTLNSTDLNRIKRFDALEELNLIGCKFYKCYFWEIGIDCKFFNSLKILDLTSVKLCIEDLRYLRNFKNLMNLSLTLYNSNHLSEKDCLIYLLPLTQLSKSKIKFAVNSNNLYRFYINEV